MGRTGYYQKNKEHINKKARKYYWDHKERILDYRKNYYEKNNELIIKNRKDRYDSIKEWYLHNVDGLDCVDCGLSFRELPPGLADFHHVKFDGHWKMSILTIMVSCTYNRAVTELNKGVFLCPTCHRIRHILQEEQNGQN